MLMIVGYLQCIVFQSVIVLFLHQPPIPGHCQLGLLSMISNNNDQLYQPQSYQSEHLNIISEEQGNKTLGHYAGWLGQVLYKAGYRGHQYLQSCCMHVQPNGLILLQAGSLGTRSQVGLRDWSQCQRHWRHGHANLDKIQA